jgi:hypothetical protein
VVSSKVTAVWDIVSCSLVEVDRRFRGAHCLRAIALIMEIVHISETSVYLYETTRRNIPEGCHLFMRNGLFEGKGWDRNVKYRKLMSIRSSKFM